MYNAKKRSRANFDRQAAIYDTASFGAHARKLYPILLAQLAQIPHRWVLDVGCGTGELLFQMARRWPGGTYRGVDLSPKMAAMARNKLGVLAQVDLGDAERLPVPDGWAQVVVCSDSFHHYPDPEAALGMCTSIPPGSSPRYWNDASTGPGAAGWTPPACWPGGSNRPQTERPVFPGQGRRVHNVRLRSVRRPPAGGKVARRNRDG